jgi:hypothetical protein
MAIQAVNELKQEATGAAAAIEGDVVHEGLFHKCPETGNVQVNILSLPRNKEVQLVLQDGNDSGYRGTFCGRGHFKPC